jgi:hypothetical protein
MDDVARLCFAGAVVAFAMAACARPAAPVDAGEVHDSAIDAPADVDVPEAATPDAALPAITTGWVLFDGPPFLDETPMHGGPDWRLDSTKLPAWIRSPYALVIPYVYERGISDVPNLEVRFMSADGAHVIRSVTLLSEKEFDDALAIPPKGAGFVPLGVTVRARIAALDAELDALGGGIVPLETCSIDPENPYADWPPCGARQTVTCGAMTLHYLGGKQTLETPHGVKRFPSWHKASVPAGEGPRVPVNECVSRAWFDRETKTLGLRIANLCASPGDACGVDSDWRFLHVEP